VGQELESGNFIAGTVDFAAPTEPISSADAAKVRRGRCQLPTVGGTIAHLPSTSLVATSGSPGSKWRMFLPSV